MKFWSFRHNTVFILPILAGILFILSYPPSYSRWLIFFTFIPLFFFLEKASRKQAFWGSWLFGFVFFAWNISWLLSVLPLDWAGISHEYLGAGIITAIWLSSAAILSLFIGIFGLLWHTLSPSWRVLGGSALWIVLEYTRAFAFGIFALGSESLLGAHWTFGSLGYALSNFPILLQSATLFGLYGASFLIIVMNFVFFDLFSQRKRGFVFLLVFFIAVGSLLWHGTSRLGEESGAQERKKVALLQTDFAFRDGDSQKSVREIATIKRLLHEAARSQAELVVLPESSPIPIEYADGIPQLFLDIFGNEKPRIIIANARLKNGEQSPSRIFFYDTRQGLVAVRDKQLLIPAGEYIPYLVQFPLVLFGLEEQIVYFNSRRALHKGEDISIRKLDSRERPEGVLLCSAVVAPGLWRKLASESAQIFVNIASLSPFQRSPLLIGQIESHIRFFAVSNDRWFVQSANGGFAYIIDNKGIIQEKNSIFGNAVLTGEVEYRQTQTPFSRLGDWPVVISLLFFLAFPFYGILKLRERYFDMKKYLGIILILIVAVLVAGAVGSSILKQAKDSVENAESPQSLPQPPGENASDEEGAAFFDAVAAMAVATETIEIDSSCELSPMVIKVEPGASLVLRNNDSLEHLVTTFVDQELRIPGQDSGSVEAPSQEAIYGVTCDGAGVGFILVLLKK